MRLTYPQLFVTLAWTVVTGAAWWLFSGSLAKGLVGAGFVGLLIIGEYLVLNRKEDRDPRRP